MEDVPILLHKMLCVILPKKNAGKPWKVQFCRIATKFDKPVTSFLAYTSQLKYLYNFFHNII